jgi:zinc transporter ZupT
MISAKRAREGSTFLHFPLGLALNLWISTPSKERWARNDDNVIGITFVTLLFYKAIAGLLIFLTSIATAIYPLKKRSALKHPESVELGEALASGIFLGAAFFHMLPDAIKTFSHLYGAITYPIPEIICISGFLLLLFLERLSLVNASARSKHSIPYILATIVIIHAIVEGAALGIGATFSETIMLFIAILAHKGSESYALCVALLRHAMPFQRVMLIIFFFTLMTPLGISLGAAINESVIAKNGELAAAIFNAFAAGTFLYISTLHHVRFHQHTEETQGLQEFACLVSGLIVMGAIALLN